MKARHVLFTGSVDSSLCLVELRARKAGEIAEFFWGKTTEELLNLCRIGHEFDCLTVVVLTGQVLNQPEGRDVPNTINLIPDIRRFAPGIKIIAATARDDHNTHLMAAGCDQMVRYEHLPNHLFQLLTGCEETPRTSLPQPGDVGYVI